MRFWDSSALLPLFVAQPTTKALRTWIEDDGDLSIWALSDVELRSGLARLAREGALTLHQVQEAAQRIGELFERSVVIDSLPAVAARARRLVMVHPLRAADALQLAAALVACGDDTRGFELVTKDERLAEAARREGFTVRP
jgi:predicted nucleic acid-binding protein